MLSHPQERRKTPRPMDLIHGMDRMRGLGRCRPILTNPEGMEFTTHCALNSQPPNPTAEYVALIAGHALHARIGVQTRSKYGNPLDLDVLEERREQEAIREEKAKLQMKIYYDAKVRGVSFRPGDFVYRANDVSHSRRHRNWDQSGRTLRGYEHLEKEHTICMTWRGVQTHQLDRILLKHLPLKTLEKFHAHSTMMRSSAHVATLTN
ncbi:hypothetical protein Tco_0200405 [Tanacetum coccineum]